MTSCNTQSERAAGIVWAVLLVAWVAVLARQVPNYNYGDSFGPTLAALGQLRPVPDSIVTLFYSDVRTVLPTVIAAACRALAVTPEAVHRFITIVTLVVALGSAAWAATSVARTCWAGVLALAALPFAWVFMLQVGYYAPFWTGFALTGYWGLGWVIAVWALWFAGPAHGWRALLPFALAAIVILAHPVWGVVLLAALGCHEVIGVAVARGARCDAMRQSLLRFGVAAAVALPQVWLILSNLNRPFSITDEAAWWTLMQFRKPFHVFIWEGGVPAARVTKATLLAFLCAAAAWPQLDTLRRRRLVATGLGVGALTVAGFACVELWPVPSLAGPVLPRGLALLAAANVVLISGVAGSRQRRGWLTGSLVAAMFVGIALPTDLPVLDEASAKLTARLPTSLQPAGEHGLPFVATTLPLLMLLVVRGTSTLRAVDAAPGARARWRIPMVAAAALAITGLKLTLVPRSQGEPLRPTWTAFTECVRGRTPPDALLVTPPYPYTIASMRRSFILDYSLMGSSIYNPATTGFEFKALQTIYGIDLRGKTRAALASEVAARGGIQCVVERGYSELIASVDRVRALKAAYPSAAFLVGIRPGVRPPEWVCETHRAELLPLPHTCANEEFLLYDLRDVRALERGYRR